MQVRLLTTVTIHELYMDPTAVGFDLSELYSLPRDNNKNFTVVTTYELPLDMNYLLGLGAVVMIYDLQLKSTVFR